MKASHLVDLSLPMHAFMSGYEEDGLKLSVSVEFHHVPLPCTWSGLSNHMPLAGSTPRQGGLGMAQASSDPRRPTENGCVQVHSLPSASRSFATFQQTMLLSLGKIVKAHGAGAPPCQLPVLCAEQGPCDAMGFDGRAARAQISPGRIMWSSRSACRPLQPSWAATAARSGSCRRLPPLEHDCTPETSQCTT